MSIGPISRRAFVVGAAALGVAACTGSSGSEGDAAPVRVKPLTVPYGKDPSQVADLYLPATPKTTPVGVVALIHGGFWSATYDRSLMVDLAQDVARRGWAAWNLEYRSIGSGGGWPATFLDVAAGMDELAAQADAHHLDLDKVAVVGHSAGGTLALWTAGRGKLPASAPGARPKVRPSLVVSQAGVNNLVAGALENVGQGAVQALMGHEPTSDMADYLLASPVELLPLGVAQVIEYGTADVLVPPEQSIRYAAKAKKAGDDVTVIPIAKGDHFVVIDPAKPAWAKVVTELAKVLDD